MDEVFGIHTFACASWVTHGCCPYCAGDGHAFMQNLRRGHYELATDVSSQLRLGTTSTELALAV